MAYNYIIIFTCILCLVTANAYLKPSRTIPDRWFHREAVSQGDASGTSEEDQEIEASERRQDHDDLQTKGHQPGRVQIKVYRGPYDEHEHFAPYGFWVKQPADEHRR